ncbi:MAG: hypothetical protein ACOYN4_16535 [Bacteroidales bacterium]
MRNLLLLSGLFCAISAFSQTKTYFTSGGEMIFSFANIQDNGTTESSIMRWAPVFNLQSMVNADLNQHVGLFSGIAVRNVGYIYGHYSTNIAAKGMEENSYTYKKKFRSYNLAIPVGIKFGNLDKMFFYAGYEVELPFLYKEKTFSGGDKIDKITGWFSDREQLFQHGFLVGIQFPYGLNLKFKYYMSEFHNQDYTDATGNKPYSGLNSHIFYFSLSSYLFKNFDLAEGIHGK